MKLWFSKLAVLIGTPVLLLGYQNCAKLGTDNLLGGSSSFVSSGSTEIASTDSSADTAETVSTTPVQQEISYKKRKTPSVDPMGHSEKLLANAWKACTQPASLQADPNGEYVVESCLNLFCNSEIKTVPSETQKEAVCTALLQVKESYTL